MDQPVTQRSYRFGEFVLDPADMRLIGTAGPVRVGNKAIAVLEALVRHHGRLLTKEELFETVWDGTIVSESALTSVIKELRRALGDETKSPRYIESVYGRGYRFLAPIQPIASMPVEAVQEVALSTGAPFLPETTTHGPFVNWRNPMLAACAALLVAAMVVGIWWFRPVHTGAIVTIEKLKVSPGDAKAQILGQNLSSDLTRMVLGNDATLSFADAGDVGSPTRRNGYILSGEARSDRGTINAALRLRDGRDGTILWSRDFASPLADSGVLRQRMASKVADVLICAFGSRSPRSKNIALADLRLFLAGCEDYHGNWTRAREYLSQVVSHRPDFAQARAMYATVLYWNTGAFSGNPQATWATINREAVTQARRALRDDPKLGSPYFVLAAVLPQRGHFAQRMVLLDKGREIDPNSAEVEMSRCVTMANAGILGPSTEACRRAAELDPFSALNLSNYAEAFLYGGDHARGLDMLAEARGRLPGALTLDWNAFEFDARLGDPKAALMFVNDTSLSEFKPAAPDLWRVFLATRLDPTPANVAAAARTLVARAPGLEPLGMTDVIQDLVQLDRLDDAYRVADLYAVGDAAPMRSSPGAWNFLWFRDYMAPFRADPRFLGFARKVGLVDIWSGLNRLPEFCGEPGLKYRCPSTPAGWRSLTV